METILPLFLLSIIILFFLFIFYVLRNKEKFNKMLLEHISEGVRYKKNRKAKFLKNFFGKNKEDNK